MNTQSHYFAVDLGATSGRTILGTVTDSKIELEEITRFPNHIIRMNGHYYWDIYALYNEIIAGLREIARRQVRITSIGIDTWGVDFVFIGKDGSPLRNPYCYRDTHTDGEPERFFADVMPRDEVYERTGIQIMNFNSLFQFSALRRNGCQALENADKILFIPDALSYLLTGKAVTEYTIASTSQMLNPRTRQFDTDLLKAVGLTTGQFGPMVMPGTIIGTLTDEVQSLTGCGAIPVVAVAGHDTGSAVAAVPAADAEFAYLSSGTWSLMGIEADMPIISAKSATDNFTNEGGVNGTIRFLKNICGMWLLERCRAEWKQQGNDTDYGMLIEEAMKVQPFKSVIFPDDPAFANPESMTKAIEEFCKATGQEIPATQGEFTRCIFDSLALRYRQVFAMLQGYSKSPLTKLHVIGGGSRNDLLNQLTANAIGVPVVAGPVECTAIGNIMMQAQAAGQVRNLGEMRRKIADSVQLKTFQPTDSKLWEEGYAYYSDIYARRIK